MWLWVMVNTTVAFFSVKASRSKAAFEELIGHWAGILVSDNYGVYRKWVNSIALEISYKATAIESPNLALYYNLLEYLQFSDSSASSWQP